MHKINGAKIILPANFGVRFVPQLSDKNAKKYSPFGRAAFAHLLRYHGLAVLEVQLRP
jgi:hypothetical protein